MPELPEVEVIRRGLATLLPGRQLSRVEVSHERVVRNHRGGASNFEQTLVGRVFGVPKRRGKYLWLPFDDGDALLVHLGMSGQFRLNDPDDPAVANTRVRLWFSDAGPQLRFVDQRMFGGLQLSPGGAGLPAEITHIAPDPFEPSFDLVATAARMRARRSTVKRALLDQTLVSGIGNIYADEALWRARTHYDYPTEELSTKRAQAVLRAAREVMSQALMAGGTSFDSLYVNVNGASGYFSRELDAYGRAGQACHRCGATMVREKFMNRSSTLCPRCQRLRSQTT